MSKFYITTPIYYVNDSPHIGHAYTTTLADVLARYHRDAGEEVFFLTGLDEHGQKVQQAAEKRGIDPQAHCDEMAPRFIELWEHLHIQYDDFIRTTEDRHKRIVQGLLQEVYDSGDIYEDEYEGWYSVAEERFITEKEVESGEFRDVQRLKEKNYFFKMSQYQEQLVQYIHDNPEFIQPDHRKNEIQGFLRQPLGDLCISRPKTRLSWGIEIPFDTDYVTYVWFDALINYITVPGYGSDEATFEKWWPAEYHLIGKDILMTHAVYWPTMLFSAGIPLPRTIFAHGWWLSGESKMSKSLGNVANPLDLIDQFGVDSVRYYLMREMVLGQDANFTIKSFVQRYNSDLANDLGNLVSRICTLIRRNFDAGIPDPGEVTEQESELIDYGERIGSIVEERIESMSLNEAIEETFQFIRAINRYLDHTAPWKVVKSDTVRAGTILYHAAEAIRLGVQLLHPVMPEKTEQMLAALGVSDPDFTQRTWGVLSAGTALGEFEIPFPRIDLEAEETKEEEKPEKKNKKKEEPKVSDDNLITFDEFASIELRTAEILEVEKVEGADKLLKIQVRVGEEQRQIVAGIAPYYTIEELVGKRIVIVANLKPAKLRGVESQGMLLAAEKGENLSLVTLDRDIGSGAKVR